MATGLKWSVTKRRFIIALAAVAGVLLWQALTVHYNFGGNWTSLFFTGEKSPVPPALAASTFLIRNPTGYDGQMYRYIAHDPFLRQGYEQYLDIPRLRYRRILVPILAWALAFGSSNAIDAAYVGVVLLLVFLGVFWCAGYFELRKSPPALGLLFLLVPATLTSVDRMLLDGPLTALAAGFAGTANYDGGRRPSRLGERDRYRPCPAAIMAHLYRKEYRDAAISAACAIPAVLWFGYVKSGLPLRSRCRSSRFLSSASSGGSSLFRCCRTRSFSPLSVLST